MNVDLTREEAQIVSDVLNLVLNDPDWQQVATATDAEWNSLKRAAVKVLTVARERK